MNKKTFLILLITLLFTLAACSGEVVEPDAMKPASQATTVMEELLEVVDNPSDEVMPSASLNPVEYDPEDLGSNLSSAVRASITLAGDSISFEGNGVTVNGNIITITSAGTYIISGSLTDGQIVVDTTDQAAVVLVLNGAEITNFTSAPIYVRNAEKTVITLAAGTDNVVTDGAAYVFADGDTDEPNAAVFSKDDLTINGSGSLTVNANYNNGIASKDDLKITSGTINVNAVNDGIKGRDSVAVLDGTITINAGGDGLQANNAEDAEKGIVFIEGGTVKVTAGQDGVQAETRLMVSGGDLTVTSGGGSNAGYPADSAKGLKAGIAITITGGQFKIDSADDAVNANETIVISGGAFVLASGDDAIHADTALEINGGDLNITASNEGIESQVITINDGIIHLVSSDDGVNASSGSGGGGFGGGGFETGDSHLYINGGYIAIDALGDGLDINGPIAMTGGVVLVNGPVANNNGALDYTGAFEITGGFLVAAGSSGMAQAPSTSSTQYSLLYNFSSPQAAGTIVHIATESGEEILTFVPAKEFQSIVVSSPALVSGAAHTVYTGGSSSGTLIDGFYSGGSYTGGTEVASFTISSMVTSAGSAVGGFQAGPGGTRPARP